MLVGVGNVVVTTTENKGHSIEFWADSAADRIVSVGGKLSSFNSPTSRSI